MGQVILRGMVALFLVGFIILAFAPTIDSLVSDQNLWGEVGDPRAILLRDNAVTLFYVAGLIAFVVIIVWMWNASQSRGAIGVSG